MEIWTDILETLDRLSVAGARLSPSRIQSRVNLPHDRFWHHVELMEARGLVKSEPLRTTAEGQRFLAESGAWRAMLRGPE